MSSEIKEAFQSLRAAAEPSSGPAPVTLLHPVREDWVDAACWIPTELKARLDAQLGEYGVTISERVVEAFNNQYENLASFFPTAPASPGPMPVFRSTRRRRGSGLATTLVRIRLRPEQKQVLDEAVATYNTNRSALVSAVLAADLPHSSESQ